MTSCMTVFERFAKYWLNSMRYSTLKSSSITGGNFQSPKDYGASDRRKLDMVLPPGGGVLLI